MNTYLKGIPKSTVSTGDTEPQVFNRAVFEEGREIVPAGFSMHTTFGADRVALELNVEKALLSIGIDAVVSYCEYYDSREGRYVAKILHRDFRAIRL
jgi:hypothetical protein